MLRVQPIFNSDEPTVSFKRPGLVSASAVKYKMGVAFVGARIIFSSIFKFFMFSMYILRLD